ncbi:hypothetical protein [Paraburkholderia humisilvae]|uniref:Uncharacterized protein n=1 Tax=Paraburkholderia humisilvae TaxID=627669 RepID=A0A6J5F0H4_9BURK|nr:hypothetical protein [Paraburkholderia humisilvae]CAB3770815.1 hypothetical protein LMG29542_06449 [Paraburkholderia humisilvae]
MKNFITTSLLHSANLGVRAICARVNDAHAAGRTIARDYHASIRFALVALWLGSIPAIAHAGIWNGGLCNIYQQVLDNELLEIVSLSGLVGALVAWLLDDGHSKIKAMILKGMVGTLGIINAPLLWAQVFNHGAACSGSM